MEKHLPSVVQRTEQGMSLCVQQHASLQSLLDSSLDVICSINKEGRFVYVSAAAKKVWGYEPHELTGTKYMELVIPEDYLKTRHISASIMAGVEVTSFENRYKRKDGTVVPVLWSARWNSREQLMYCVGKDATQIKAAEEQKKYLNKRLLRAYQLAGIAWWEYDVATQTYTSSDEIFGMYGLPIPPNNQTTLEEFLSLVHPDDKGRLQYDLLTITLDHYHNYEHRIVKPTGEIIHVIHYSEVIRDSHGVPVAVHGTTKDITKRKLRQLKLEESEKRLQEYSHRLSDILESIGDGFYTVDRDWTVTYWNKKAEQLLGKEKKDMLGRNLWMEYNPAESQKSYTEYHRALNEQVAVQFEEYFSPLKMWIEVAAYPSAEGLSVYFKDITHKKWQEHALQLANERFELVAKATSDALWDWDIVTNNCFFNEGFTVLFGHENTADLVYKNWMDNIHEADKEEVLLSISEALNDAEVSQYQVEYRFYRKDRSLAHVLDRGYITRNKEGKAERMVGSMQDITKLRNAEEEMKKLSLVAKETENVVVITDAEGRITWVNKAFNDITAYTLEEALGKKPGELLQGKNTSSRTKRYLQKCVEKRRPFQCEIINYTKSGREYWVEIKGQPIFNEKGELQQFFAIQTDITNRKKTEAAIRLSEEKYRLLFYSSPRPKFTFHSETLKVVDVNDAAVALYGYSREEFLHLTIDHLKFPEDKAYLISTLQTFKEQNSGSMQKIVRHKKKNGEAFYIEISSFTIQLSTGLHIMVTGTDMTEKLQLQQQLIAEKISAQKQIARAIIHAQETERSEIGKELHDNVCQILTTAKLYIENIKYMPDKQEAFTKKGIDLLLKSINEIRYLSRQLVSPVSAEMDFETSVNELLNHYRCMNLFEIRFSYNAGLELVDKDLKTSIIRILQEQFNNTVKYANASVVHVTISNTDDTFQLLYEDDGIGFDPSQAKKGIGLANIKNRAGAYRGTVHVRSAVGKGCSMEITFPLTEGIEAMY